MTAVNITDDSPDQCGVNECNNTDGLGHSEERNEPVCTECVEYLAENGHYPDEEGPEQNVTAEYDIVGA